VNNKEKSGGDHGRKEFLRKEGKSLNFRKGGKEGNISILPGKKKGKKKGEKGGSVLI